jgi:hypothetical protein
MNLFFDDVQFRYDPYPIGLAKSVLSSQDYTEMVENWPAHELFFFVSQQGNKYSLSEAFHAPRQRLPTSVLRGAALARLTAASVALPASP